MIITGKKTERKKLDFEVGEWDREKYISFLDSVKKKKRKIEKYLYDPFEIERELRFLLTLTPKELDAVARVGDKVLTLILARALTVLKDEPSIKDLDILLSRVIGKARDGLAPPPPKRELPELSDDPVDALQSYREWIS